MTLLDRLVGEARAERAHARCRGCLTQPPVGWSDAELSSVLDTGYCTRCHANGAPARERETLRSGPLAHLFRSS